MCKFTKYLNGRILSEKESMCVTTLLREGKFYPPGNRRKSAAAPSDAVLPSAASTVTVAMLEVPSSESPGPFLSRREEVGSPCVAGRESGRVWGNVSMSYFAVTGFQMKLLLSNNILMPWQLQYHFITLSRFDLYFSSRVSIGKSNHYDLTRWWIFFWQFMSICILF